MGRETDSSSVGGEEMKPASEVDDSCNTTPRRTCISSKSRAASPPDSRPSSANSLSISKTRRGTPFLYTEKNGTYWTVNISSFQTSCFTRRKKRPTFITKSRLSKSICFTSSFPGYPTTP